MGRQETGDRRQETGEKQGTGHRFSAGKSAVDGGVSPWPYEVVGLLLFFAALLVYFQYTTLDKFRFGNMAPGKWHNTLWAYAESVNSAIPLEASDAIVAGLIVAVFASLVVLEIWKHRLSSFLNKIFETESRTILALSLFSALAVRFYFARGEMWTADASSHVSYAWVAARAFSHGEIPVWTNYFCTGSPFLQFYGFLFFYLVALIHLLVRDFLFSIKLVMAAGHVLSGIGMYLFVRTLCKSRRAGFIAGIGYVLTFWHTQQVLVMGRLPLSVFYALLPLPFYFFERLLISSRKLPSAVGGGIALALLTFTHPGYAFWATALWTLYAAIRLCRRGIRRRRRWPALGHSLLLLITGVVTGAYLWLPMWVERDHTGLYAGFSMSSFPDPTWQQLLVWSNYNTRLIPLPEAEQHWYGGYLGISLVGLAAVGLFGLLKYRRSRKFSSGISAGICLIASLILVFGYRWPVLRSLSVVQALNAGRYLLFVVFFLSAMAGIGLETLIRFWKAPATGGRVPAVLLLIVAIDLGPTTFRHPYHPQSNWPTQVTSHYKYLKEEAEQFPDDQLPSFRIFHATINTHAAQIIAWIPTKTGMVLPLGAYNESPLAVPAFCDPLVNLANTAIENPVDSPEGPTIDIDAAFLGGLYLLNTKYLIAQAGQERARLLLRYQMPSVSPIAVSPKISGWEYPPEKFSEPETFQRLIDAMGIYMPDNTCKQILLTGYQGEEDLQTSPAVEVLAHRVYNQRVELRVRTSAPCFARLAYAYYPYLYVTVNDRPVTPLQTAGRFIALRLDAGEQRVVLEARLSPLRRTLLVLNLCLLAAAIAAWVAGRRKPSQTEDTAHGKTA